ncbi:MAG: polyphosphate polymerase domain-containing protein [Bacteroidales bacterium]|nr:polyphosphate polymerase domain-containing protein [Bacteroidales bacterium]MCU0407968.1 polyphosphate polymerase domain-containing protein [Bacteroidales bacterium]
MQLPLIESILRSYPAISLADTASIRLMNRNDTKFIMPLTKIPALLSAMNGNYRVLEINDRRELSYSTAYLDTEDFRFYEQHVTGRKERKKIRFRTYLTTGESFLEIKSRNNKGRTIKTRTEGRLPSSGTPDCQSLEFINSHIPDYASTIRCVLTSSFTRISLASENPPERITIDYNLSFSRPGEDSIALPFLAIAELKRDAAAGASVILEALKSLGIRQSRFSKYCTGASLLYDELRRNTIKPGLLLLNKIENEYSSDLCA